METWMLTAAISESVMTALGMMGKGMLGIFVVIGLIAIIVAILAKFSGDKKDS